MKKKAWLLVLLAAVVLAVFLLRVPLLKRYYPLRYEEQIGANAKANDLPESLLCAVIWCESRFRPQAESASGACGLMQLTPATFEELLGRLSVSPEEQASIFDPDWNIRCGAYYLRYLYDLFGDAEVTLAAYNAGMGNVRSWLADERYSDDGRTLKAIPFSETAAYVKRVKKAKQMYETLYFTP